LPRRSSAGEGGLPRLGATRERGAPPSPEDRGLTSGRFPNKINARAAPPATAKLRSSEVGTYRKPKGGAPKGNRPANRRIFDWEKLESVSADHDTAEKVAELRAGAEREAGEQRADQR